MFIYAASLPKNLCFQGDFLSECEKSFTTPEIRKRCKQKNENILLSLLYFMLYEVTSVDVPNH
ncbi:CLUMA_CG004833, isoform A [Clunio marinus]|uniref:CLUMA_CG004833, isoform A n=1 Tax=Clunio marinus TaxID=568069 RepID=A0A1J1HT24_9DIPT|nr:CLUMA_CG004833, isoform A [Clunio marinus]